MATTTAATDQEERARQRQEQADFARNADAAARRAAAAPAPAPDPRTDRRRPPGRWGSADTASADVRRRRPNADSAVSRTIPGSGPAVFENILSRVATNTIHPTWPSSAERIPRLEVRAQIGVLPATQHVRHIGRHFRRQHRRPEHIERGRARLSCARMIPCDDEKHHDERDKRDADPPVETAVPRKSRRGHSHCWLLHTLDVAEVLRTREKSQTSANL